MSNIVKCLSNNYLILNTGYTNRFLKQMHNNNDYLKNDYITYTNSGENIYPQIISVYDADNKTYIFNDDDFNIIKNILKNNIDIIKDSIVFKFIDIETEKPDTFNFKAVYDLVEIIGCDEDYKFCAFLNCIVVSIDISHRSSLGSEQWP